MAKPSHILREHTPLAPLTTMGLGGPARYLANCVSLDEMRACLTWAAAEGLPVQVLGGGSNVLFADAGYSGLVLKVGLSGVVFNGADRRGSGWRGLGWFCAVLCGARLGRRGVSFGHPRVGGCDAHPERGRVWPRSKRHHCGGAGARPADLGGNRVCPPAECGFAYRQSRFKGADRDRFIVTSVTYRLDDSGQPQIRYPELCRHVNDAPSDLSHCARRCACAPSAASPWSSTRKIPTPAQSAPSS